MNVQRAVNDTQKVSRAHLEGSQTANISSTDLTYVKAHMSTITDEIQSTGVRGYAIEPSRDHSSGLSETNDRALYSWPTSTASSLSLMNPPWIQLSQKGILPVAETIHKDLCWQDQPIQAKLGNHNSGTLGHSDSIRGLSHSPHVCPP